MIREDFPRPAPTYDHSPYWEYCKRHEFRLQRCSDCGAFRFHSRPFCPGCQSNSYEWTLASGKGTVYTYTICYPPVLPAFQNEVPYNAVVVQLAEGPFMVSNVIDIANDDLKIGMPVELVWVDIDEELTIPRFRPA